MYAITRAYGNGNASANSGNKLHTINYQQKVNMFVSFLIMLQCIAIMIHHGVNWTSYMYRLLTQICVIIIMVMPPEAAVAEEKNSGKYLHSPNYHF